MGHRRQRGGLSQLALFASEERGPGSSSRHVDWGRVLSQTRDLFAYVWLPWELQVHLSRLLWRRPSALWLLSQAWLLSSRSVWQGNIPRKVFVSIFSLCFGGKNLLGHLVVNKTKLHYFNLHTRLWASARLCHLPLCSSRSEHLY